MWEGHEGLKVHQELLILDEVLTQLGLGQHSSDWYWSSSHRILGLKEEKILQDPDSPGPGSGSDPAVWVVMAGRGRGRRTLGLDPVGTSRGDSLPPAVQQPTPVFPVMEQKPLPLAGGEESEYLTALKQDFRVAMRSQPCFIQPAAAHRDVERYSDKYHLSDKMDGLTDWIIDWKRFPKELRVQIRKPRDGAALSRLAAPPSGQKKKKKKVGEKEEVLLKLETLEKKEQQESSEEEGEEQKEDEAEAEEEYDEEEFEEETDYIMSYFDNGEDFGGDSDDNMDEAVY